jgi:ABC-type cobalt transport system substrate-binding protein
MKNLGKIISISILTIIVCLAIVGWIALSKQAPEGEEGPWGGVDVNVIEKYASDAGREAREPFINTDKGDMLLFVFALGGAVGGFVAGYYWRRLVTEKR